MLSASWVGGGGQGFIKKIVRGGGGGANLDLASSLVPQGIEQPRKVGITAAYTSWMFSMSLYNSMVDEDQHIVKQRYNFYLDVYLRACYH